ncbi:hypothetical protein FSP39_022500 [Pinctada imbricata]|uniref:NWD1/2-like winged helix-turn-helix domain-containing protein n=1 Tax=Pinctada imbricata TaxID=66713 RepID=A0AA88XPE5_PINIB|nr:hypothetical protein FSP39_022500 [Pinctada imbricata]
MLIILLDSLESISTNENGHKLEWLPSRIAQNVKIIVTADCGATDMVKILQHKCEDSMTVIPPFVSLECENVMKVMMNTNKISVNINQWKAIREVFQSCRLPIFINLTLESVKLWRSYDTAEDNHLGRSVEEVIENILIRTEKTHGSVLVTHVLGYLAASSNGLSESELLDILSLDDVALNNIFTSLQPKIRRFPPAILVQILQDIDIYVAEMETDGILVLRWRHSQFNEIARKRYLSNEELKRYLYFNMADYYLGTWGGSTQKPYTDSVVGKERRACRLLPEQPYVFGTCDIDKRYNLRKMTLLPPCLLNSCRHDELRSEIFCNYSFLYNRIKATSLQQLLTDFDVFNDRECNLVSEALRMSGSAILYDMRSLVIELIGRLLPLTEKYKFIEQLVHQCDLDLQRNCPLVPNVQCYSTPGGPLQSEGHTGGTQYCPVDVGVFKSSDGILLTAKPFYSTRVRVWELSRGDPRPDMMMPVGRIHHSRDGNFLVVFQENKQVKIFRSDCGDLIGEIQYGFGVPCHIEVSKKYLAFTIEKGCSPFVIELEDSQIVHKFGYHSNTVAINQNDTFLACNSGKSVILFELPLMQRRCVVETSDVPKDITFISSKLKCFVSTKGKTIESIVFDVVNKRSKVNKILTDLEIRNCVLSNTEAFFLVQSGRCLYLIDSVSDVIVRKLVDLPYGIDVDLATTFTGAGFSADDSKVVAPRANFLAIWDVATGSPLRVLQSSACYIKSVFTSDVVNKAVTILDDGTFQVWNLDNIDTDILHSNNIFPGKIEKISLSTERGLSLAYGNETCEAKIVNFGDGYVKDILQHSDEVERLNNMLLSKDGRFAITCADGTSDFQSSNAFDDHVLWDIDTGIKLLHSSGIRFAMFSDKVNLALFVKCVEYDRKEWIKNIYNVIQIGLPDGQDIHFDFPDNTEFVCSPKIATQNTIDYLVFIGQTNRRTYDHETKQELANWIEIRLFVKNISSRSKEMDRIRIQNLVDGADDRTQFLEIFPTDDEKLLILYGRNIDCFEYNPDKGLVIPEIVMKGAILYDIEREECLRHIPGIFRPDSFVSSLLISKDFSVALDGNMNLFSGESYRNVHFIDTEFSPGNYRLALNGKYIVGLLSSKREIVVVRTTDGKNLGHVYVHGEASCLEVGDDDRTVVVGCEDGRVMILTLILDTSDPVTDIIMKFPSRSGESKILSNWDMRYSLLRSDLHHMRCRTPDTSRLSARSRRRSSSGRRTPDHQTISTIVRLTRRNSQNRSEACCLQ